MDINYLRDIAGKSMRDIAMSPGGQLVQGKFNNVIPAAQQEITDMNTGKYRPQIAFGGEMENVAPTPPMDGSIEQIIEKQGGWQPGMRQQFDTAMFNKDPVAVKALLPSVPPSYAARFADMISNILGGK